MFFSARLTVRLVDISFDSDQIYLFSGNCDSIKSKKTSPSSFKAFDPENAKYKYWISNGVVKQKENEGREAKRRTWTLGKLTSSEYRETEDMILRRYEGNFVAKKFFTKTFFNSCSIRWRRMR